MPIVLQPDPALPLDQGDLLAEIETSRTGVDGQPNVYKPKFVLVLSRPCNAMRDGHVVVAPVEAGSNPQIKEPESPEELLRAFARIRDGEGAPDRFYLGAFATDDAARFVAKLDELYTIEVPKPHGDRRRFLDAHRRFRLDPAFARDLHLRMLRAFASLGFDDVAWWSDADLALVVARCDAWADKAKAAAADLEAHVNVLKASGEPGKLRQIEEDLSRARRTERELRSQYERERLELERRKTRGG